MARGDITFFEGGLKMKKTKTCSGVAWLVFLCMIFTMLAPISKVMAAAASRLPVISIHPDTIFYNYSSDKKTIFLNDSGKYNKLAFFDFYAPLRPFTPKRLYPLSKYEMADPYFKNGSGDIMVSLDELSKLYAPYFTYGIDESGKVTIRHFTYIRATSPTRYIKTLWEAYVTGDTISVSKYTRSTATINDLTRLHYH